MGQRQKKPSKNLIDVREILEATWRDWSSREHLHTDPLQFPHRYKNIEDQEVVAFIAAIFAFGNVKAIHGILEQVLAPLGKSPAQSIAKMSERQIEDFTKTMYYRFFSSSDLKAFFGRLRNLLRKDLRGIKGLMKKEESATLVERLAKFRSQFLKDIPSSPGIKFMLPDPEAGCAKRFHLLLRWMVRKDEVDLGIWNDFIRPSELLLPLDTHLFDLCAGLKLTKRKTPSRQAMEEITAQLREWNPEDPLKYDFALCRLGIMKHKKDFLKSPTDFLTRRRAS